MIESVACTFQIASEPVLIVDSTSLKIVEANPASAQLLNKTAKRLTGRNFLELFDADGSKRVQAHLSAVRTAGSGDEVSVKLNGEKTDCLVSASLFRQDTSAHFLVRLSRADGATAPKGVSKLFSVVENLPDGFVVTDLDRRILKVNAAFLDMVQLATEEQAKGELFDRWVGRSGVDVNALTTAVREHGAVQNFATVLRGQFGSYEDVEISAVSVLTGEHPCYGFTIRRVNRQEFPRAKGKKELPRSVEQLTGLVGRVSLKELVRETTDVIEKLCIEAALELTGDNRASAAEVLGLSRQSLYSKLRRHGIDFTDDEQD